VDVNLLLLAALIILGIVLVLFLVSLARSVKAASGKVEDLKRSQTDNPALSLMQQQIGQLTNQVNQQLQNMSSQFQKTTGDIGQTLGDVQSHLGKVEVTAKEVLDKAKNIANLEDLLRAPKFRGGMGEFFLGDLLAQILPPEFFSLQHRFKSGEKVDAAIKIGSSLVPVDAKFPLENFKKYVQEDDEKSRDSLRKKFAADVKKHIDDVATKYILPDEGTYEFAMLYIPAENIYYETIIKDESFGEERSLLTYALKRKVIPVSPNSFYAYLQVIIMGLRGLQIEQKARDIYQSLARLQGDLVRFRNDFQALGTHLVNAKARYDEGEKRLLKFSGRLDLVCEGRPTELAAAEKTASLTAAKNPEDD
jgi:DNA recombination protein RmuC